MKRLIVRFDNKKDLDNFSKKLSLTLTKSTKEIYLPKGQDNKNKINRKYGLYGQTMGGGHTPMIEDDE